MNESDFEIVDDSNQEWYDRVAKGKKALQVRRAKLAKVFRQAISDDDPVTVANAAGEYLCLLSSETMAPDVAPARPRLGPFGLHSL